MKALPLIIFFLLLQIISPITAQTNIAQHLAFPPVQASNLPKLIRDQVNIYQFYTHEPAPMGIADYGISPSGAFVRESIQWEGKIVLNSLSATSNDSYLPNSVSLQLNVVLNYGYNGNVYALWVQDIAVFNTQTNEIAFLDNIWNLTTKNANVNGIVGNGHTYNYDGRTYYSYAATSYPGSYVTISLPTTIYLLVNVTTNSLGEPVIYFWYNDGYGWVHYDTVTVTNAIDAYSVYFLVDGYTYTGSGNDYDAELVIGGPGNATTAYINSGDVYLQLFYWNRHNFQEVRNAFDFGSDTAETVSNAVVQEYYNQSNGELMAKVTTGYEGLMNLWNQNGISQLTIYSSAKYGCIYVYNKSIYYSKGKQEAYKIPFLGGEATLTLYPMTYAILVYQNGELVGEANIYAGKGQSVSTNTTAFSISLNESSIYLYTYESNNVGITMNAYGNVSIDVISPSAVNTSFTQKTIDVNGQKTVSLIAYPTQSGTFTIIVNASIFPGFYETQELTLHVYGLFIVIFEYNIVGQPLPQEPVITLNFPNGTSETIQIYNGEIIKVPEGTSYALQQIISEGNTRWASPTSVSGVITSNQTIIAATYFEQYLVDFQYTVTNGQWTSTPPNVTYQCFLSEKTVTVPTEAWVNYNSSYYYSPSITVGKERIISTNYKGTVTSPGTINVYYTLQYYITVESVIPVYAMIDGKNVSLSTGWYNAKAEIQIENLTYYPSSSERYVITSISPSETVVVSSPITIQINVIKQFYVNLISKIPVHALINGKNETLESGWYNNGTEIHVENITYYPSKDVRYVILSIEPLRNITVNSPSTIRITAIEQLYITLSSVIPVHAIINGVNETLENSWFNANTTIYVENLTYYPAKDVRYVITGIQPSEKVTLTSPITITVDAVKQYYITVKSVIPVKAIINSTSTYLNTSWINEDTEIHVLNYTYYVTNEERYVITGISPQYFTVTSPVIVNISTVKQFLVTINNVSKWYNQGSTVPLKANVPIYDIGKFVGTYNVSPNTILIVNSPIKEKLVLSPNYVFYGEVGGVIAAIVAVTIVVILLKRGKKGG